MIFEIRTYQTKPGMRARFLDLFRSETMPEHNRLGMPIVGPFLFANDPDRFFFMRGFRDVASQKRIKASFYEDRLWGAELEEVMVPMLVKYEVVLVEGADNQIRRAAAGENEAVENADCAIPPVLNGA